MYNVVLNLRFELSKPRFIIFFTTHTVRYAVLYLYILYIYLIIMVYYNIVLYLAIGSSIYFSTNIYRI